MKDIQHIGPAIKARRQARGWSQAALCEAAGNAINTSTLSTTENGMSLPNVMAAYAVAKALGTTVEALIEEANNPGGCSQPQRKRRKGARRTLAHGGRMEAKPRYYAASSEYPVGFTAGECNARHVRPGRA